MELFDFEQSELKNALSEEEFNHYFQLYKDGDINARNTIVEHNIKLVISIVNKKFHAFYYDREDLISEGVIALITALNYYDPNKGIKFSTYATKCIVTNIAEYCAYRIKTNGDLLSLDKESELQARIENNLYGLTHKEDDNGFESFENADYLNYVLEILTPVERDVLEMFYGIGKYNRMFTEVEISKKYKCSRQWISERRHKLLETLKLSMENNDYREKKLLKKNKRLELSNN